MTEIPNRIPNGIVRRQPQQKRSKERVENILKAAAEVFLEMGYETATTHDIASRAQTSVGSIYQFFPDKLSLFHALEIRHLERVQEINRKLLTPEIFQLPLETVVKKIVETHADYFKLPIPQIVYIQYFVAPEMFILFNENLEREMIQHFARLLRGRNQSLNIEKSEIIALVAHRCYNSLLLVALRSQEKHRQHLYAELIDLLVNYLRPHVNDKSLSSQEIHNLHNKVMKCSNCDSQRLSKNGHRYSKQRYLCKDCGKQFLESYASRGYGNEVKQQCLKLHRQGMSYREIERQTGVSHNTVINWVKKAQALLTE